MLCYVTGTDKYKTDVLPFEAMSAGGSCTDISYCTAIKISDLKWGMHGKQSYYMTIKATNAVGLHTVASSDAYVHNVGLAAQGVVFDVEQHSVRIFCSDFFLQIPHTKYKPNYNAKELTNDTYNLNH